MLVCEQRDRIFAFPGPIRRQPHIPTTIAKNPPHDRNVLQDDRIASLDRTWRGARAALATERDINEKRQEENKPAEPLS